MNFSLQAIAEFLQLPSKAVIAVGVVLGILLIGSLLRIATIGLVDPAKRKDRLGSLLVWWIGMILVVIVASGGLSAGVVIFGALSLLGLREYFRLCDRLNLGTTGRGLLYFATALNYLILYLQLETWIPIFIPVMGLMLMAAALIGAGKTRGYLASLGGLVWGAILLGYFLPHAVRLFESPARSNPVGHGAGWFIYLIVLTECDDIFQALWGRQFGKRRITPEISPNKTLEGLLGGVVSTVVIGIILAPWLTPLAEPWAVQWRGEAIHIPYLGAILACLLISLVGFLGDLNMSALKRDAGVKDTGAWLPGQGGILDRLDSLTFTAPAFYYFVTALYP